MNYASIKFFDVANGPGVRVSLFVSGCTHRCKGCFNAEAWDFSYGEPYSAEVEESIIKALSPTYIKGLSLLGGEPFEPCNQAVLVGLLERVRALYPDKSVWCYTGYELDKHVLPCRLGDADITRRMLSCIDVLVDGEFIEAEKDLNLRFRGSSNQRIIDVSATLSSGKIVLWDGI